MSRLADARNLTSWLVVTFNDKAEATQEPVKPAHCPIDGQCLFFSLAVPLLDWSRSM